MEKGTSIEAECSEQLEEVLDMLETDLSVSSGGRASSRTSSRSNEMSGQEALGPDDMSLDEFKKRTLEHAELEAEESAAKKTHEGESSEPVSPSRALYPPLFAGRVSQEDDVFHWDEHEDLTAVEGEDIDWWKKRWRMHPRTIKENHLQK